MDNDKETTQNHEDTMMTSQEEVTKEEDTQKDASEKMPVDSAKEAPKEKKDASSDDKAHKVARVGKKIAHQTKLASSFSSHTNQLHERAGFKRFVAGAGIICALVLGIVLGHFVPMGSFGTQQITGKAFITDADLKSSVATYEYEGKQYDVTAQEVITNKAKLEKAKQQDGTYKLPTPEEISGYVRGQVIVKDAEKKGITATDDEITEYAKKTTGAESLSVIAEKYNLDEEKVKSLMRMSILVDKLRKQTVGAEDPQDPQLPAAPKDEDKEKPTAEFAKFVLDLAKDEWDSDKGAWKAPDGPYATALKDFTITNDGATYAAAQAAYKVAVQQNQKVKAENGKKWQTYINSVLTNVKLHVFSLNA